MENETFALAHCGMRNLLSYSSLYLTIFSFCCWFAQRPSCLPSTSHERSRDKTSFKWPFPTRKVGSWWTFHLARRVPSNHAMNKALTILCHSRKRSATNFPLAWPAIPNCSSWQSSRAGRHTTSSDRTWFTLMVDSPAVVFIHLHTITSTSTGQTNLFAIQPTEDQTKKNQKT